MNEMILGIPKDNDIIKRKEIEDKHSYRNYFERDRDRILYSTAFRRLSGKTQVFLSGFDDHVRTRLTHTLEVSQISRTISHSLDLNSILCEAISLGHDLGHVPFGHVGEEVLNHIMNCCDVLEDFGIELDDKEKGFKHNWQSIRVLLELEKSTEKYSGLNVTNFTLWGILHHTNIKCKECGMYHYDENGKKCRCNIQKKTGECLKCGNLCVEFYQNPLSFNFIDAWSFEGYVVANADEISQRHHDVEDGIIANIIGKNEITKMIFKIFKDDLQKYNKISILKEIEEENDKYYANSLLSKLLVDFYVSKYIDDVRSNFNKIIKKYKIKDCEDFLKKRDKIKKERPHEIAKFSNDFLTKDKRFKDFLKTRIINSHKTQMMNAKATYVIKKLFEAYLNNPRQLTDYSVLSIFKNLNYFKSVKEYDPMLVGKYRDKLEELHYKKNDMNYKKALVRTICDHISGMTDNYAMAQFEDLYESVEVTNY